MKIWVTGYLTLRDVFGKQSIREFESERITIREFVRQMSRELEDEQAQTLFDPETGEISRYAALLVNGRHYSHLPDGLDSELVDGDDVAVFPPVVGG